MPHSAYRQSRAKFGTKCDTTLSCYGSRWDWPTKSGNRRTPIGYTPLPVDDTLLPKNLHENLYTYTCKITCACMFTLHFLL